MTQTLPQENNYVGQNLSDAQWAGILGCDAKDVPLFRDYLQSSTKICVAEGYDAKDQKKYRIEQYVASHNKDVEFVWWIDAVSNILFDDYKSAKKFANEKWIPNIVCPEKMHDGKPIPAKAYLLLRVSAAPTAKQYYCKNVYTMTPAELALCKKYHGR